MSYVNDNLGQSYDDALPEAQLAANQRGNISREWRIPNGEQTINVMSNRTYKFFIDGHRVNISKTDSLDRNMITLIIFVDDEDLWQGNDPGFLYTSDGFFTVTNEGIFTTQDELTFENGNVYLNRVLLRKFQKFTAVKDRLDGKKTSPNMMLPWPFMNYVRVGDAIMCPSACGLVELLRVDRSGFRVVIDGKLATVNGEALVMISHDDGMVTYSLDTKSPDTVHVQTEVFSELYINSRGIRTGNSYETIKLVDLPGSNQYEEDNLQGNGEFLGRNEERHGRRL